MRSPQIVTLICIGPVPNIAAALKREPRITQRARFVGMHGSVHVGYNGESKPAAEYNVKEDPQACQAIFTAPWEMTITPLDTCDQVALSGERYQRILNSKNQVASDIIANYRIWANKRGQGSPELLPIQSTVLFDTVAVYLASSHDWCGMQDLKLRVTDDGSTVEDPNGKMIHVAMTWKDLAAFEDLLVQRLTGGR
jgi:inosine-uridine nucleoside N-ribohydrolase